MGSRKSEVRKKTKQVIGGPSEESAWLGEVIYCGQSSSTINALYTSAFYLLIKYFPIPPPNFLSLTSNFYLLIFHFYFLSADEAFGVVGLLSTSSLSI